MGLAAEARRSAWFTVFFIPAIRIVIIGAVNRLAAAPLTADGGPTPEMDAALARAKQVTVLELLGSS